MNSGGYFCPIIYKLQSYTFSKKLVLIFKMGCWLPNWAFGGVTAPRENPVLKGAVLSNYCVRHFQAWPWKCLLFPDRAVLSSDRSYPPWYWTGISNSTLDKTRSIMGPTGWLLLNYRRKKASVRQEVLLPRSYRENTEGSTETREVISVASLGRAVQGLSPMNMAWIRGRKGGSLAELQPRLDCTKSLRVWFGTC